MRSTGWIAVAGWLIAAPVLAQDQQLFSKTTASETTSSADRAAQPIRSGSFDVELEQLRQEIAAIKTSREQVATEAQQPISHDAAEAHEQRRELLDLLTKLATKNLTPKPAAEPVKMVPKSAPKTNSSKSDSSSSSGHPLITTKIVDAYALGRALFRAEDYVGAEQAFRKVKVTDDNRVLLQYLVATCLRKQSRWEPAAKAYRIVAENKDDPALRDLAEWQLENIRWHQKTESQLEELRQLREQADSPKASTQATGAAAASR